MGWKPSARGVLSAIGGVALLAIGQAAAETPAERGAYLVTTIGACGNCHSPRDASGDVAAGKELSGGVEIIEDFGRAIAPNITPDAETGIGKWTDAQIITGLRDGKRPDATILGPPMPVPVYRQLSDGDTAAIAAYLRGLRPIRHAVARSEYKIPLPPAYGPPVTHVEEPVRADKIAYGKYLATFGHCVLCHTPPGGGEPFDMSKAFTGGRELPDISHPGAVILSRNITSDPAKGIGKWSDAQVRQSIVAGIRPDGTKLNALMPSAWYKGMVPADVDAIIAFVRTIPPGPSP